MPSVIVTKEARADVIRLRQFLRENSPQAAARFGNQLADTLDMLARFPRLGRPVPTVSGLYRLSIPFGVSGYVMLYRYITDSDGLQVLRIRHDREKGD